MAWARRRFDAGFKAKVALKAIKGLRSVQEIAQQFQVHPNQVSLWKKQLLTGANQVFEDGSARATASDEPSTASLYEQIGRLKVELEWLKKKLPRTRSELRSWIDRGHASLSARRQCELLGVHRSRLYYETALKTRENLELMLLIDEQYLRTPFWGSRNITNCLRGKRLPSSRPAPAQSAYFPTNGTFAHLDKQVYRSTLTQSRLS